MKNLLKIIEKLNKENNLNLTYIENLLNFIKKYDTVYHILLIQYHDINKKEILAILVKIFLIDIHYYEKNYQKNIFCLQELKNIIIEPLNKRNLLSNKFNYIFFLSYAFMINPEGLLCSILLKNLNNEKYIKEIISLVKKVFTHIECTIYNNVEEKEIHKLLKLGSILNDKNSLYKITNDLKKLLEILD
jgi:hypothetical protein